jgi:uncharacterized membrane protein YbhN (UPF0104 family)
MTAQSQPSQSRFPWVRVIGTLAAAAALVFLLAEQGWTEILAAIGQIHWQRLLLAFGLMLISRLAVSGRWHILLRSAGLRIPAGETIRITFAGLFASNFLPTTIGGDVARLAGAILLGFDRAISLASLVVDRLVGMAGMALVLPLGAPPLINSSLGILPFGAAPAFAATLDTTGKPWWKPIWMRIQSGSRQVWQALILYRRKPGALLEALAFTAAHMLCLYLIIEVLLAGMGQSLPLWVIAGLWSITYFVTLLPISINGLGVQELILAFLFTRYGGISGPSGLTLALLMRVLPVFASLPGALFIPGILNELQRQKSSLEGS